MHGGVQNIATSSKDLEWYTSVLLLSVFSKHHLSLHLPTSLYSAALHPLESFTPVQCGWKCYFIKPRSTLYSLWSSIWHPLCSGPMDGTRCRTEINRAAGFLSVEMCSQKAKMFRWIRNGVKNHLENIIISFNKSVIQLPPRYLLLYWLDMGTEEGVQR